MGVWLVCLGARMYNSTGDLAGSRAMRVCEPRQARKGAAVTDKYVPRCAGKVASFISYESNMSYKVLALKWRPRNFAAVVGQQATLLALQHALRTQQLHHAYLFTGTRGVGKTTLARILAKGFNCNSGITDQPCGTCEQCLSIDSGDNIDVIEVDAASRTKVEDTRDMLDNIAYAPVQARFKVYIIDEVHMLSNHSFNALLKTLEEPPAHVKFILATTDPQKLPVTVLSRCLQFHLRHLTVEQISQHLEYILQQEQISFETPALLAIAQAANGSMRDALSLLEQVVAFGERKVDLQAAQQVLGTDVRAQTLQLLQYIIAADAKAALLLVREMAALNADFNQVLKIMQTLVHQLSLIQVVPQGLAATNADFKQLQDLAAQVAPLDLQLFYQAVLHGVRDLPYAAELVIGFEMIVLRMLAFQPVPVHPKTEIKQLATALPPVAKPIAPAPVKQHSAPAPITSSAETPNWGQLITQLNLVGLTKVLAENCSVGKWQDNQIELILNETQKPLLNSKHVERIQEALQKALQRSVQLTINIGTSTQETPAAQEQRQQQAVQSAAIEAIQQDKHIQQLTETFGAKIAEITINEK